MDIDNNTTSTSTTTTQQLESTKKGNPSCIQPLLKTSVERGRKLCIICFAGAASKNAKRAGLQKISDIESYKKKALEWMEYDHSYNKIYEAVDWDKNGDFYAHKICKGCFNRETFMTSQRKKEVLIPPEDQDNSQLLDESRDIQEDTSERRKSGRLALTYQSDQEKPTCIVCCDIKKKQNGTVIPVHTMTFREEDDTRPPEELQHLAEKSLKEFAQIHVDKCTKFKDVGKRILLNSLIQPRLFTANVGYHTSCYASFRASSWKRPHKDEPKCLNDFTNELVGVAEYLILVKREVYTLKQLRELYADIMDVSVDSVRSIDIKELLEERLQNKIQFCKPTCTTSSHGLQSEYVLSADANILPDALNAIITGDGISNYMQMKSISRSISLDIQSREKVPWPPTPQDILQSDVLLDMNKRLYNMIAWVVSPNASMGKNGFVGLSYRKATKVSEIVQNIQSLVPGAQPGFNQILLSLTTLAKTGSQMVVNDLMQLGHGLSNTETMFIQDKWAEWSEKLDSIIPSNIKKGVIATHVFDNIDWKNKSLNRIETHHTNSILVQTYDIVENFAKVSLDADYNFDRKHHRSYKGSTQTLPNFYYKRGKKEKVKFLKYIHVDSNEESAKSTLYSLVWIHSRITKGTQRVPSWSGFKEQISEPDLNTISVGYLPPIPFTPTDYKVILAEIRRTQEIRKELETDFIFIEADQAIYTKVLDVMFSLMKKGEDLFPTIIPRMGGFHIGMCMLRTIHSLYKRCGIVQLLSSAGLGGFGTVQKALTGGDVKEGINLHKKLYEALLRTKIKYITNSEVTEGGSTNEYSNMSELRAAINRYNFENAVQHGNIEPLTKTASKGSMGWLMDIYIEMVDMLLNYIHFLRIGNWEGYMEVLFEFLPYCFRLNRHNYARNLSFYYVHMRALKDENTAAYKYLENGGFSGSLTGRPHSRIPFDQVIEMTINRSCKDVGGLAGSTQNPGATERWTRIHHHIVALREHQNKKIHKKSKQTHVELGAARIRRDEQDVVNIQTCIETWLPEMWKDSHPITNVASGEVATAEMVADVIDLKERGATARDQFINRFTKEGTNLTYYEEIKRQPFTLFEKKQGKKKQSIPVDEGQSFTEVLTSFDQKKLNLRKIVEYCVTSRPWMIVNEEEKSRNSNKHLFRNHLQNWSPVPKTHKTPETITTSIVDAMRVVRMITVAGLKPRTFKSWANNIMSYLSTLAGDKLHVIFDNYDYEYNIPSKQRDVSHIERFVNSLDQELPPTAEWEEFLKSQKNKLQIVNLLVDYIKAGSIPDKTVFVNKGSECYLIDHGNDCLIFPQLDSAHREADQKIPMHAVYAGQLQNEGVCVVAEDTDIYLSLLSVASHVPSNLYFRQGKSKDKDGICYHDVISVADNIGKDLCNIILAFHTLTGSDYTNPFYGRSKINAFKKMQKTPNSHTLLSTILSGQPNISDVTDFVLHIIYNRPLKETSPGETRYNMLMQKKKQRQAKNKTKKFKTTREIPPDQSSLKMKILRASFTGHCMSNCLNPNYVPLDPSMYAWKLINGAWEPIWYEGSPLPNPEEIVDEDGSDENSSDVDETETSDEETPGQYNADQLNDDELNSDSSEYATSESDCDKDNDDDDRDPLG